MRNGEIIAVVLGVGLAGVFLMSLNAPGRIGESVPRGIRNNNPGNIRFSAYNNWRGQIGVDTSGFVIFDTEVNGIRAMSRILLNDINSDRPTIRLLIEEWAPDHENPTSAYAQYVSNRSGVGIDTNLVRDDLPGVVEAMIRFENGVQPYSMGVINSGVAAA